ncbi:hypothetical protein CCMSSC00406_0006747 [Pleurotus cornucopiae]|uniref:Uncharacterized protein n=1 Tax=Pleurotus cornucopiae TaxID=5321 RepID=A0ACB7IUC0_PLECO|nr:hypothetical protein CCMSSC00406_0006747 [Pleurotus cornucopiae]
MSRAQTPVNSQRPPLDGVHSTPQSAGSGSNLTYDTQSTRLHYSPYLYQDLSNEKIMAFEDFCKTIFDFDFDQPKKPITKKLRTLLDRYRLPVTEETGRYEPFILLANEILRECGSEYVFVRNDPKYLWGIDPGRKPDILLVHKSASLLREPIVQGPEEWPERVVAKLSWLPSSREPEHDILKEIQKAIVRDPSAAWVSDHLPNVLYSQVCDAPDGIVASLVRHFKDDYEERRLYLLVMEELGCIDAIKDCDSLKTAYKQIVRCHHWVYERAGILHRDISVKNLMFRQKNDTIVGVLNDFDLATPAAKLDKGPTSKQRTGTWPYLAIELLDPSTWLQPPPHLYRYDLESFFWVLLTLAVDPDKSVTYNILRWSEYDHVTLYNTKSSFFFNVGIQETPLQPQYERLRDRLTHLAYLFDDAKRARVRSSSNTIVEMVTAETFLKILSS